jgi:hypothetical protein
MVARGLLIACMGVATACPEQTDEDAKSSADPQPKASPSAGAAAEEPAKNVPDKPPAPPEPPEKKSVGEMNQKQLEAACFQGRQAACDRLGH